MKKTTAGIHHITAIVGNPQENVDFYADVLGLRLVKKTVNFDDPGTYHLYFGNEGGQPGTIITFFPWDGAQKGRIGSGQVGTTTFVAPEESLNFWEKRLANFSVKVSKETRFNEEFIQFKDPHGLHLEIVARKEGANSKWDKNSISPDKAIKGFGGAVLNTATPYKTANLLEHVMGMEKVGQEAEYLRFQSYGNLGNILDINLAASPRGIMGVGTVHHIAFRASDFNDHKEWQTHLDEIGFYPTDVKDRDYFEAIYFREQGGLLFEIATDPPGFTRDESFTELGEELKLPKWLESKRSQIEDLLTPFEN
ncbi:ring-cleaving dioxygenase [Halobacillus amylolyticus]|uniref:Ring-cleaving dioxygenase n=1 Tax=Halobacillus amylolyticus TaxID=2932259 RepID=A0ABY4HCD2_9BACI|nr:ring-cleaving dioxygenase [Halobacillus amylolyticus]UOR12549.1 ring-cleaving dioxygenase [Halobacillus amylolyticus]